MANDTEKLLAYRILKLQELEEKIDHELYNMHFNEHHELTNYIASLITVRKELRTISNGRLRKIVAKVDDILERRKKPLEGFKGAAEIDF
jgi:uncharacterized coiled-coil DUF342 family protein